MGQLLVNAQLENLRDPFVAFLPGAPSFIRLFHSVIFLIDVSLLFTLFHSTAEVRCLYACRCRRP